LKKNHLILLTGNRDFFGQTRKPWVSMQVPRLVEHARQQGVSVDTYSYHQAINQVRDIRHTAIFYSFSQISNTRHYLKDLIYYLDNGSNLVVPAFDLLMCHEDKGFQELYKRRLGLQGLATLFFSSPEELRDYDLTFPVVVKEAAGTNGKQVHLIRSRPELERLVRGFSAIPLLDRIDLIRRKHFRRRKHYAEYPNYDNRTDYHQYIPYVTRDRSFIVQEFVPGLTFDYRVLILYDRFYMMKRGMRPNDFRGSGTKMHDFNYQVDPQLFNFAAEIHRRCDTPFLSLDIGFKDGRYYLFEFQALHFGLGVYAKQQGYFSRRKGEYVHTICPPDLERDIMGGLIKYLRANKIWQR